MKPSVFQFNARGRKVWGVDFLDALGKKRRKQFASGEKARAFARDLWGAKVGEAVVPLTVGERRAWERIREAAKAGGWEMGAAVERCVVALGERRGKAGLLLADAVARFLDAVEARNLRAKSVEQYRGVLGMMCRELGGVTLAEVSPGALAAWVRGRYESEASRLTVRTRLRAWAAWCAGEGREWLPHGFARGITWERVRVDARPIEFLTGAEVGAVLAAAPESIRFGLVLVAFAGVRPREAERLTWAEVNWETKSILVPGAAAKTRATRRLHDLPENVWAWLATAGRREGPIVTTNHRNAAKALLRAREAAGLTRWPHDCLRHSFGTHGWHRGAEWCAATMGHVRGFDMLAKHYRGCVSAAEARAYFEVRP